MDRFERYLPLLESFMISILEFAINNAKTILFIIAFLLSLICLFYAVENLFYAVVDLFSFKI